MERIQNKIHEALRNADIDGAKKLINRSNANDNLPGYGSILIATMVHSTCTLDFIDYLLDLGCDINTVDTDNETALFTAVRFWNHSFVLHLLKRGIRVGVLSTRTGGYEIDNAISNKCIEITWLLYSHNARPCEANMVNMNELIGPYIRCLSIAHLLIGIRKFRRSVLSQHPKEIILMIGWCITRTRKDPKWTV
jgi:ankyrin repeat protein